jgi:hypothetical protein
MDPGFLKWHEEEQPRDNVMDLQSEAKEGDNPPETRKY